MDQYYWYNYFIGWQVLALREQETKWHCGSSYSLQITTPVLNQYLSALGYSQFASYYRMVDVKNCNLIITPYIPSDSERLWAVCLTGTAVAGLVDTGRHRGVMAPLTTTGMSGKFLPTYCWSVQQPPHPCCLYPLKKDKIESIISFRCRLRNPNPRVNR